MKLKKCIRKHEIKKSEVTQKKIILKIYSGFLFPWL